MAKRKRPILYEVFGSQTRVKGWGSSLKKRPAKSPGKRSGKISGAVKELRVSYELAIVIGLLTVVLGGTLYYFGWVRGNDPGNEAALASQAPSVRTKGPAGEGAAPRPGGQATPEVEQTYFAVRVFTASYGSGATKEQVREQAKPALAVRDFLINEGYTDARAIRYARSRSVVVYVGKADSSSALDGLTRRLRRLTLAGKKQFKDAYPTKVTVRK